MAPPKIRASVRRKLFRLFISLPQYCHMRPFGPDYSPRPGSFETTPLSQVDRDQAGFPVARKLLLAPSLDFFAFLFSLRVMAGCFLASRRVWRSLVIAFSPGCCRVLGGAPLAVLYRRTGSGRKTAAFDSLPVVWRGAFNAALWLCGWCRRADQRGEIPRCESRPLCRYRSPGTGAHPIRSVRLVWLAWVVHQTMPFLEPPGGLADCCHGLFAIALPSHCFLIGCPWSSRAISEVVLRESYACAHVQPATTLTRVASQWHCRRSWSITRSIHAGRLRAGSNFAPAGVRLDQSKSRDHPAPCRRPRRRRCRLPKATHRIIHATIILTSTASTATSSPCLLGLPCFFCFRLRPVVASTYWPPLQPAAPPEPLVGLSRSPARYGV